MFNRHLPAVADAEKGDPSVGIGTIERHGGRSYPHRDLTWKGQGPVEVLNVVGEVKSRESGLDAKLSGGWSLSANALDAGLLRIAVLPPEGLTVDRTWMIAPDSDTPWEGRPKLSRDGFAGAAAEPLGDGELGFVSDDVRVRLWGDPLRLEIERRGEGGDWQPLLADRGTGGYVVTDGGRATRHCQARPESDRHFGLGDKAGPLDRTGRRFRVLQLDALGFDAEIGDPLYKHAPFVIVQDAESGAAAGLVYDTMAEMVFDLGAERSNYHGIYRYAEARERGLVCYVLIGADVPAVVERLTALTGRPHFAPRRTLGFGFTSMHHADAPDAQAVIANFAETCRERDVPISMIHSGSGYTLQGEQRCVFTWDRDRFPDPEALFERLGSLNVHTAANVKPVLLTVHPAYAESAEAGRFARNADGSPVQEVFWGGTGSSLDFTNPETVRWWQEQASEQVLTPGFGSLWNDNNEAEIWDEEARVDGFGQPMPAVSVRPLQAHLMTRASFEVTAAHEPDKRPYTITRAGPIGVQRYAETWTGDTSTSWHSLKWNLRNGLSLSLSGMPQFGHDVGGFCGPEPEPELLLRWVQMMALHPRCVMNSWRPEAGAATLPWTHEEVFDDILAALRLRYTFLPYLYTLAHRAHTTGQPIIRPLFYASDEPAAFADHDAFLLGDHVLVAPVVAPGETSKTVYLPEVPGGWIDFWAAALYEGGQEAVLDAPAGRLPLLIRCGAVLPLAQEFPVDRPHDPEKVVLAAYPGIDSGVGLPSQAFFDDGESWGYRDGNASLIDLKLTWEADAVTLEGIETMTGAGRPELSIMIVDPMARGGSVAGDFGLISAVWERQFPFGHRAQEAE